MKKSTFVCSFFIKVTSVNLRFVNNKETISYLQKEAIFGCQQLLIQF